MSNVNNVNMEYTPAIHISFDIIIIVFQIFVMWYLSDLIYHLEMQIIELSTKINNLEFNIVEVYDNEYDNNEYDNNEYDNSKKDKDTNDDNNEIIEVNDLHED